MNEYKISAKILCALLTCCISMVFFGCSGSPKAVENCPEEIQTAPVLDKLENLRRAFNLGPALGRVDIIDGKKWLVLEVEPGKKIPFQPLPDNIVRDCSQPEKAGKWLLFRGKKPVALRLAKGYAYFWLSDKEMDCFFSWDAVPDLNSSEQEQLVFLETDYLWDRIPDYNKEEDSEVVKPPEFKISETSVNIDGEPGLEKIRLGPNAFEILSEKGELILNYPDNLNKEMESLVLEDCGTSYSSTLDISSFDEKSYIIYFTFSSELISETSECNPVVTSTVNKRISLGPVKGGQFKSYSIEIEDGSE